MNKPYGFEWSQWIAVAITGIALCLALWYLRENLHW